MPLGVVLAGGAGRRMGGEKALVELAGRPLLHYPIEALLAVVDDVVVACKEHTPLPDLDPRVEIWCDDDARRHPLLGVTAVLRRAAPGGRSILVCAGDMPLVTPAALRSLRDAPDAPAVVARAGGRLQPLLARYGPAALAVLDAMDPDEPATRVVERLDPLVVELEDDTVAFNVNAPEDLLLAERERVRRDA
jgi:molybdopterin-guanine dinucleotide biosynthesis protein A